MHSRIAMSSSTLTINSKSVVILNTIVAKHTEIMKLPEVVVIHSMYSVKVSATWKIYIKCEVVDKLNMRKAIKIFVLNGCG